MSGVPHSLIRILEKELPPGRKTWENESVQQLREKKEEEEDR